MGDKPVGSRYFTRYGRVWTAEDEFDANRDDCLTGEECRLIDSAIDAYNDTIVDHVVRARMEGLDWHVFELCGLLDSLAYRRYLADPLHAHDSIAQIALACGFADFGHFSRRYKDAFGASPREDRMALRSGFSTQAT